VEDLVDFNVPTSAGQFTILKQDIH